MSPIARVEAVANVSFQFESFVPLWEWHVVPSKKGKGGGKKKGLKGAAEPSAITSGVEATSGEAAVLSQRATIEEVEGDE